MRGLPYKWVLGVLIASCAATPAMAGVTLTGDANDSGSSFTAGGNPNATGGLVIDGGSVFSRTQSSLGRAVDSTGTGIVTGAGSQWINSGVLSSRSV